MNFVGECSGTIDLWTDRYTRNEYITMTVHYLNCNWDLTQRTLFTIPTLENKTAANIKKAIDAKFDELHLPRELFEKIHFVSDEGSNIGKLLAHHESKSNCSAHLYNLVLKHAFDDADDNIKTLIKNAKNVVTFFKKSSRMKGLKKTLRQAIDTRWNTNFLMLSSISEQFEDVERLIKGEKRNEAENYHLNRELLLELVDFLRVFQEAFKDLQRDRQATIQKDVLWKAELKNHCNPRRDESLSISNLKHYVSVWIEKKICVNMTQKIGTFLTPNFKNLKPLTADERRNVIANLKNTLSETPSPNVPAPAQHAAKRRKFDNYSDVEQKKSIDDEIDLYLKINDFKDEDGDKNTFVWWREHQGVYPNLAAIARKVLIIPSSSASSERNFSSAGRLLEMRRTALNAQKVDKILFLRSNLK